MNISFPIRKIIPLGLLTFALICGLNSISIAQSLRSSAWFSDSAHLASSSSIELSGNWEFLPDPSVEPSALSLHPADPTLSLPSGQWQPIAVPANWYLQGHDLSGTVWYQRRFIPPEALQNEGLDDKVVKLTFAGVDYAADVWLNGHYLGFHEGYFQPFSFLVSQYIQPQQVNVLTVRVNSPTEIMQTDWSLHKRLIKGIFGHHDARPGGAWSDRGQDKNTGGIWAPVYLQVSEQVAIDSVKVTPRLELEQNRAIATVELTLTAPESFTTSTDTTSTDIQAALQLVPENFSGAAGPVTTTPLHIHPGVNQFTVSLSQPAPKLWWTWDQGKSNLYRLKLSLLQQNKLLDQREEVFGFRSIEYTADSKLWRLNGRRIFLRGTNYIATQWLSEMTPQKYGKDIELMRRANINSVRIHAHITAPDFYQICDREGLLIWQDFPLQWGYQDTPEFTAEAVQQGKAMINLLYNHPSIIAWSLHNEPPWDATWMKQRYQHYDPNQNRQLDETLYASLIDLDRTRYLHLFSGIAEHPWWGWYSADFRKYAEPTTEPLITEFGAQALANLPSLRKIFTQKELFPDNDREWKKWEYHNFQPRETFEIAQVPMGETSDEFIQNTQRYQSQLIQFAAEAYRRQRFQPVSAIFQFMFSECWASINWGMIDYWRQPKPGYEALQTAYQPVLPSIVWTQQTWKLGETIDLGLWLINDRPAAFPKASFSYTLSQKVPSRPILLQQQRSIDLPADSGFSVEQLAYQPEQPGIYQLEVTIASQRGQLLGRNRFEFAVTP